MGTEILKNQRVLMDGYDLTGVSNAIAIDLSAEAPDATPFGVDSRQRKPGLRDVALSVQGFYDAENQDVKLFSNVAVNNAIMAILNAKDEASVAYFLQTTVAQYNVEGAVGDMLRFGCNAEAQGDLIRGVVLGDGITAAKTASENLAAQQLGAVSASQSLYAALNVFSVGGTTPTLDVTIESDAADDFSGSETTQITFDQKTAIGAQYKTAAGAITDTWYRGVLTIGGTTPSFGFSLVAGIR